MMLVFGNPARGTSFGKQLRRQDSAFVSNSRAKAGLGPADALRGGLGAYR